MQNLPAWKGGQKRRKKAGVEVNVEAVWSDFESGLPINGIAKKYGIPQTTLQHRLQQVNGEEYKKITCKTRRKNKVELDLEAAWTEFKSGLPITKIAKKQKTTPTRVRRKLLQNNEQAYKQFAGKRGRKDSIEIPLPPVWADFETGLSITEIAKKYRTTRDIISRRLRRYNSEKYEDIMNRRWWKNWADSLWADLENGLSVRRIAKMNNMNPSTLYYRLRRIDGKKFKEIMKVENTKRSLSMKWCPFLRRKLEGGADSLLELQVMRTLKEYGIPFEFHVSFRMQKHRFVPDFVLNGNTILEVAGVAVAGYWERYREKVAEYARYGYNVIVVVPNNLGKRAREYLPLDAVTVVKIRDFDKKVKDIMKSASNKRIIPFRTMHVPGSAADERKEMGISMCKRRFGTRIGASKQENENEIV